MKFRNLGFATIIFILVSLSFSSCESDGYRWQRASLIYNSFSWQPAPTTNNYGAVAIDLPIDLRDISINARDISRIELFDSYFLVTSKGFRPNDRIDLYMSSQKSGGEYRGRLIKTSKPYEFIIDVEDRNYALFVENLMYEIERHGSTTLYIDIETNIPQGGIAVDFEFFNNLDVELSR